MPAADSPAVTRSSSKTTRLNDYNYYNGLYYSLESPPLPKGEVDIKFVFTETGGVTKGLPGGKAELHINGKKVDDVKMPDMHISTFSLSETFDVGIDAGKPVSNKYRVKNHYPFTGSLNKAVVTLTGEDELKGPRKQELLNRIRF